MILWSPSLNLMTGHMEQPLFNVTSMVALVNARASPLKKILERIIFD
jgi:hypothetical protein